MKGPRTIWLPHRLLLLLAACGGGHLCPLYAAGTLTDQQVTNVYRGTYQTDNSFGSAAEKQAALQQIDAQIAAVQQQMRINPSESRQTLAILQDARRRAANAPIRAGGAAGSTSGSSAQQMFVNQMLATYDQLKADMEKMDAAVREQARRDSALYGQKEAEGVSRINRTADQALSDLDALEAREKGSSSSADAAARQRQQRVLQYLDHRDALIKEIQTGGMSAEMAEVRANAIVSEMLASEGLDWSMAVIQDPHSFQPGAAFASYPDYPGLPSASSSAGLPSSSAPSGGITYLDGDTLEREYMQSYFANVQPRDPSYVPVSPWRAPRMAPENLPPPPSSYYDMGKDWLGRQYESNILAPMRDKWNSHLTDDSVLRWHSTQSSPTPPLSYESMQRDGMDTFWKTGKYVNDGLRHANALLVTSPQGQAALERMIKTNGAIIDNRGNIVGTAGDVTFGLAKDYTNIDGVPKELKNMGYETVKQFYKKPDGSIGNLAPAAGSAAKSSYYDILKEIGGTISGQN